MNYIKTIFRQIKVLNMHYIVLSFFLYRMLCVPSQTTLGIKYSMHDLICDIIYSA